MRDALDHFRWEIAGQLEMENHGADIHPGISSFMNHLAPALDRAIARTWPYERGQEFAQKVAATLKETP